MTAEVLTDIADVSAATALEGDTGGQVKIQGAVSATGYRYTTPPPVRPTTGTFDNATTVFLDELDADVARALAFTQRQHAAGTRAHAALPAAASAPR